MTKQDDLQLLGIIATISLLIVAIYSWINRHGLLEVSFILSASSTVLICIATILRSRNQWYFIIFRYSSFVLIGVTILLVLWNFFA
jgi:hypothetical protein